MSKSRLHRVYHRLIPEKLRVPFRRFRHWLGWALFPSPLILRWARRRLRAQESGWCFILGVNNSGTTLLHQILAAHPELRCLPSEGQQLTSALKMPCEFGLPRLWGTKPELFRWTEQSEGADITRLLYDWEANYPRGAGRLVEKSPPNSLRSRWYQRHFAAARFIAITRSPYAVCEGIRRRCGHSIEQAAIHWTRSNEYIFSDMPHLKRSMWFRYEDLCGAPGQTLADIQGFLELERPFEPATYNTALKIQNIEGTPSTLRDFNADSIARLSAAELAVIEGIAGALMKELGYPLLSRGTSAPGLCGE